MSDVPVTMCAACGGPIPDGHGMIFQPDTRRGYHVGCAPAKSAPVSPTVAATFGDKAPESPVRAHGVFERVERRWRP